MSNDAQAPNADQQATELVVRQADGYVWKLCTTCAALIFWTIVCVAGLWALVKYHQLFSPPQPWALSALVAALGGLIGGLARALYYFSFDSYAFNHRLQTKRPSQWVRSICPKQDDAFDPIWVWYLWCLKPVVGAMVGLVLALAIELGLISLGAAETQKDMNLRLLVLGGITGLYSEIVLERVRSAVGGKQTTP